MEFSDIQSYIDFHSSTEPAHLQELSRQTYLRTVHPHMLSGHVQGRLLSLLVKLSGAKNILEIGTFTGYATLCMAEGLPKDGRITSIDFDDELAYFHEKFIRTSEKSNQIELVFGNALEEIPKLNKTFDFIFLDADKENYPNYYDLLLPKLNLEGLLLADNVLWYEKVLKTANKGDEATLAIQEFNKKVLEDKRVEVVILPLRDGLSLIRKIA